MLDISIASELFCNRALPTGEHPVNAMALVANMSCVTNVDLNLKILCLQIKTLPLSKSIFLV